MCAPWPLFLYVLVSGPGGCLTLPDSQALLGDDISGRTPDSYENVLQLAQLVSSEGLLDLEGMRGVYVPAATIHMAERGESKPRHRYDLQRETSGLGDIVHRLQAEADPGDDIWQKYDEPIEIAEQYRTGQKKGWPTVLESPLEEPPEKERKVHASLYWDKGIVPYSFNIRATQRYRPETAVGREAAVAAMRYLESFSCIRFMEWNSTSLDQDLPHSNHLMFVRDVRGGGCYSAHGNTHGSGQVISCCGSTDTCLRLLVQALGLSRDEEGMSRDPEDAPKDRHVDKLPDNAHPVYSWAYKSAPPFPPDVSGPYDYQSVMQAPPYAHSMNGLPTLALLEPELDFLVDMRNERLSHYDLQAVNTIYCTAECQREAPALHCQNDGFVGKKGGECACICPTGFQGKQCEQLYKYEAAVSVWPGGEYGLVMTADGCPGQEGDWETGARTHVMGWRSHIEADTGIFHPNTTRQPANSCVHMVADHVCMRKVKHPANETVNGTATVTHPENATVVDKSKEWPPGAYCIYQQGDSCPHGFASSSLFFSDYNSAHTDKNEIAGALPQGEYDNNTMYYYCCRSDGSPSQPIHLPSDKPFILFRMGGTCQLIEGMRTESSYIQYDIYREINRPIWTEDVPSRQQPESRPRPEDGTPSPDVRRWANSMWLFHCYYYPVSYDNVHTVQLTTEQPSYRILSTNFPDNYPNAHEFLWHIKAPAGRVMALRFDTFDVEDDGGCNCIDSLEIRTNLLAQPQHRYCGHHFHRTLVAYNGFVFLWFRTNRKGTDKGFNGTISIIPEGKECYNLADRGASYGGKVNYTEYYTPCVPWESVQHCPVNLFREKYMTCGLVGHNYCRNPNKNRRPWCYVDEFCRMEFCDVCGFGECHDVSDDCESFEKNVPGFCQTEEAFTKCHKTCKLCGTGMNQTESECAAPSITDPKAKLSSGKTAFKVGEKVTVICNDLPYTVTSSLTCLSDGTWSGLHNVCHSSCPDGWERFHKHCYRVLHQEKVFFTDAEESCKSSGGHLVSIHNNDENEFVRKLIEPYGHAYIGLTDYGSSDVWYWKDGTYNTFANWEANAPLRESAHARDCAYIRADDGTWSNINCEGRYRQCPICKRPFMGDTDSDHCVDELKNCTDILSTTPSLCEGYSKYARGKCRRTCGLCPDMKCEHPGPGVNTVTLTPASYLSVGDIFEYRCKETFMLDEGHLERVCLRGGIVTGGIPVCKPEEQFNQTYGHRTIPRPGRDDNRRVVVSVSEKTTIRRHGQVLEWRIYSTEFCTLVAQIWRTEFNESSGEASFRLVGQNMLHLHAHRVNIIRPPTFERIRVIPGDVIGWYYPPGSVCVPYADCAATYDKRQVYQAEVDSMDDFAEKTTLTLKLVRPCRTYSVQAVVGPGTYRGYSLVSTLEAGGYCVGASSAVPLCNLTLDGHLNPFDSAWVTMGEGVGSWIRIALAKSFTIVGGRLMQRFGDAGQIQRVELTFSDGTTTMVGLEERLGSTMQDEAGRGWDSFDVAPVDATWIQVTVKSVYSTHNNGFIEIQFYAECFSGWKRYADSCYRLHTGQPAFFAEAEKDCLGREAQVASIHSRDENRFINDLRRLFDIYLGLTDENSEGSYQWSDSSELDYVNWVTGQPHQNEHYDCVGMRHDGTWQMDWCQWHLPKRWICKKPATLKKENGLGEYVGERVHPRSYQDLPGTVTIVQHKQMTMKADGSVSIWKVYSKEASRIALQIWRPLPHNETRFSLVGENFAMLEGGRVTMVEVPAIEQIAAKEGDIIGWYLASKAVGVEFDACDPDHYSMKVLQAKRETLGELIPGKEGQFTQQMWRPCRIYSVGAYVTQENAVLFNVAAGANCTASSNADLCGLATDSIFRAPASQWVMPAVLNITGQWLQLTFAESYRVAGICVTQGFDVRGQIETVEVGFSSGASQQMHLWDNKGTNLTDYTGQSRQCLQCPQKVDTSMIKLTVTKAFSHYQAGIVELQVYSDGLTGWETYKDSQYYYKLYTRNPGSYLDAKTYCRARNATVASIQNLQENGFIHQLQKKIGADLYLGYTRQMANGEFAWEDGTSSDFTYWREGQPDNNMHVEGCTAMRAGDGRWEDVICSGSPKRSWICKKPRHDPEVVEHTSGPLSVCQTTDVGEHYRGHVRFTHSGRQCLRWEDAHKHGFPVFSDVTSTPEVVSSSVPSSSPTTTANFIDKNGDVVEVSTENAKWNSSTNTPMEEGSGEIGTMTTVGTQGELATTNVEEGSGSTDLGSGEGTPSGSSETTTSPHGHLWEEMDDFCRNPNNRSGGVWCYTGDPLARWEYCGLPRCTTGITLETSTVTSQTEPSP